MHPVLPSSLGAAVAVPLPSPRRCWVLCEDEDTGEWEVATFETREAIAVVLPAPSWDAQGQADAPLAEPVLLTWAPDGNESGLWWIPESQLYWDEAAAMRAARERTREARAARRRTSRRASSRA